MIEFADVRLPSRFWDKVSQDSSGCWLWTAGTFKSGYGAFWLGKMWRAHRLVYLTLVDEKGDGYVLHSCDRPLCVNPAHLSLGTQKENQQQMSKRGRGRMQGQGTFNEVAYQKEYRKRNRDKAREYHRQWRIRAKGNT